MDIHFYDDPLGGARDRAAVRLKQLGLYVYPDRRRVAVGFDITPFTERPSIEVVVTNDRGEPAGSMTVIETLTPNLSLVLHLRDRDPTAHYHVRATLYYATPETAREDVHTYEAIFDVTRPGDQTSVVPDDAAD